MPLVLSSDKSIPKACGLCANWTGDAKPRPGFTVKQNRPMPFSYSINNSSAKGVCLKQSDMPKKPIEYCDCDAFRPSAKVIDFTGKSRDINPSPLCSSDSDEAKWLNEL